MTDAKALAEKIWSFCFNCNRAMIHDDVHIKNLESLLAEAVEEATKAGIEACKVTCDKHVASAYDRASNLLVNEKYCNTSHWLVLCELANAIRALKGGL